MDQYAPMSQSVLHGSAEGSKLAGVRDNVDSRSGRPQSSAPREASHGDPASTRTEQSAGLHCFDQLLSWRQCRPRSDDSHLLAEKPEQPTILSFPPLAIDAYTPQSRSDIWTHIGWSTARIRHLFEVLFTWDYLPFCLLCKDLFLRDYHNGSDRFCSVALVYSILALVTRLINEYADDDGVLPPGWLKSGIFYERAQVIAWDSEHPLGLPDIQALGFLSLYHLRCGREAEAQESAEACAAAITQLCQHEHLMDRENEGYARVRATTYCGAVSLTRYADQGRHVPYILTYLITTYRMLSLATGRVFNVSIHAAHEDLLFRDQLSRSNEGQESDSARLGKY